MQISTLDGHVAGGAVRLVTGGLARADGDSMAERAEAAFDAVGHALLSLCREPRGHGGTITAVLAEPDRLEADAGLLFYGGNGRVRFCGHGLIGATALALGAGLVQPRRAGVLDLDTLAGPMTVRVAAGSHPGTLPRLSFCGPPASLLRANQPVVVGRRTLRADVVWTGTGAVAIVDAEAAGVPLVAARALEIGRVGLEVLRHLAEAIRVEAPATRSRVSIDTAVFIGVAPEGGVDMRSGSVDADGTVERTPGTTATVALAAVLSAMGMLGPGRPLVHQGLAGTSLSATILAVGEADGRPTVEVEVESDTWPTGEHTFRMDRADPLRDGIVWG
jgi:proline racemase